MLSLWLEETYSYVYFTHKSECGILWRAVFYETELFLKEHICSYSLYSSKGFITFLSNFSFWKYSNPRENVPLVYRNTEWGNRSSSIIFNIFRNLPSIIWCLEWYSTRHSFIPPRTSKMGVVSDDPSLYKHLLCRCSMQSNWKKEIWLLLDDVPSFGFAADLPSILHHATIIGSLARKEGSQKLCLC